MPTTAEILNAAADLLEKPGAWTQGQIARDSDGLPVFPGRDDAVCWCLVGAVNRAANLCGADDLARGAVMDVARVVGPAVVIWNDARGRTQAEVVAALRQAAQSVPA